MIHEHDSNDEMTNRTMCTARFCCLFHTEPHTKTSEWPRDEGRREDKQTRVTRRRRLDSARTDTQSLSPKQHKWGYAQARAKFAAAPRGTDPAPQESTAALLKYTHVACAAHDKNGAHKRGCSRELFLAQPCTSDAARLLGRPRADFGRDVRLQRRRQIAEGLHVGGEVRLERRRAGARAARVLRLDVPAGEPECGLLALGADQLWRPQSARRREIGEAAREAAAAERVWGENWRGKQSAHEQ